MHYEAAFLQAMVDDASTALLLADWLEERGDPRGELLRLTHHLTQRTDHANRPLLEERLRALVGAGVRPVIPFRTNSLAMQFAWIPSGTFLMGSPPDEPFRQGSEARQEATTLSKGFWLGVHPVTQAQWQAVMGANPSRFRGDDLPVERISWGDAVAFCEALGKREGKSYRLPTEVEWEYACRAGTTTMFHFGDRLTSRQANYKQSISYNYTEDNLQISRGVFREKTTPVGGFPPNAWGLFDMHGNVWEWCQDRHDYTFTTNMYLDVVAPFDSTYTVDVSIVRGGSWEHTVGSCRSASPSRFAVENRCTICGCRAVLGPD